MVANSFEPCLFLSHFITLDELKVSVFTRELYLLSCRASTPTFTGETGERAAS